MDYTATVDIETSLDVDSILEKVEPYSGAVADSKNGYRAVYTYPADNLDTAYSKAKQIAETIGEPYAIEITPSALIDKAGTDIPHLLSIAQAAEMLDISVQAIHKRLKVGTLTGVKVGNTWVIPLFSVIDAM